MKYINNYINYIIKLNYTIKQYDYDYLHLSEAVDTPIRLFFF